MPIVESSQPGGRHCSPNTLPPDHENDEHQVVGRQEGDEDARNDHGVALVQHPVEEVHRETEADGLLAQVHSDEHLGRVGVVRIHRVGEGEGEVEVGAPLGHPRAEEKPDPVQIVLSRQAVNEKADRRDDHSRQHDAEAHLRLAYAIVAPCQTCGEQI